MQNRIPGLEEHIRRCPQLAADDLAKFLYQSVFATGHMLTGYAAQLLRQERTEAGCSPHIPLFEPVGGEYVRFHLNAPGAGAVSDQVLLRAMKAGAVTDKIRAKALFEEGASAILQMLKEEGGPVPAKEFQTSLAKIRQSGYQPIHHSEGFRAAYCPSYRLVPRWFQTYFDVITRIQTLYDSGQDALIAIDGQSAGGKSTMADRLARLFDCNLWHMDDFFLQKEQRTPERLALPGGNVDFERFSQEVYAPLLRHEEVLFRRFDCARMELGEAQRIPYRPLNLIEGAYSMRPEWQDGYALTVFVGIDPQEQERRIRHRNGDGMLHRFLKEWIPMENRYISYYHIRERADIVIDTE